MNVVYLVIAAGSESESEAIAFSPKAINKTLESSVWNGGNQATELRFSDEEALCSSFLGLPSLPYSLSRLLPRSCMPHPTPPTIPSLLFSISNSTGFRFWVLFSSTLLLKIEWFWLLNRCLLLFISGIFLIYPKTLNSGLRYFPFLSLFYLPIWFLYYQVHSFYLQYWFWLIISTYLIYQTLSLAFLEQTLRRGEVVRMK